MNIQTNINSAANNGVNIAVGGAAVQTQSIRQSGVNVFRSFNLFL